MSEGERRKQEQYFPEVRYKQELQGMGFSNENFPYFQSDKPNLKVFIS